MRIKIDEGNPAGGPEGDEEGMDEFEGGASDEKRAMEKDTAAAFAAEGEKLTKKELPRKKKDETGELAGIIANLTEELKKREEELVGAEDRALRAAADADNFKKRLAREREEEKRYASAAIVESLLPILDNFEKAVAAAKSGEAGTESIIEGVEMIHGQLMEVLKGKGLERLEAVGKSFDPETMEAVHLLESAEHEDGSVVSEYVPGYRFKDRIIRPAKVQVAKNTGTESGLG